MQIIKSMKIIQLITTLLIDAAVILFLYFDVSLRYRVFTDKHLLILCILFWVGSLISLLFLFLDLNQLLKVAASSDPQE